MLFLLLQMLLVVMPYLRLLTNINFNSVTGSDEAFLLTVNTVEPIDIEITDFDPVQCFGDNASISFSVTQTGVLTSNTLSVEVFENDEIIFTNNLEVGGDLDLDFCFPGPIASSQSIIATLDGGAAGLPIFTHNLQDGDIFGFFNAVNPILNPSGFQCVGGFPIKNHVRHFKVVIILIF